MDLQAVARALGGEVAGHQVLAPGPGHSARDRSLAVRFDAGAPDGFLVFSHAGNDWRSCRDHVRRRLGVRDRETFRPATVRTRETARSTHYDKQRRAGQLWSRARDPRRSPVEIYLASRGLYLPDDVAGHVVRFHPECPWAEDDNLVAVPAMVAVMRNIKSDAITGVHRTRLTADGSKVGRRMLGIASGSAIKLDADEAVTVGLTVGEGIETCLAARHLGFRPVWALGSVGAIAAFPVLAGIEGLTILAEKDDSGASQRAVQECGKRWHDAGREVVIVEPKAGDINDALREAA